MSRLPFVLHAFLLALGKLEQCPWTLIRCRFVKCCRDRLHHFCLQLDSRRVSVLDAFFLLFFFEVLPTHQRSVPSLTLHLIFFLSFLLAGYKLDPVAELQESCRSLSKR